MKIAIEVKVALFIFAFVLNGVLLNVSLWCMNQKSNIYLTLGFVCAIVIVLGDLFAMRKYVEYKLKEDTNEKEEETK